MGKIAFVFSGQGAQYSGMGKELFNNNSASEDIYKRLDLIRPNTSTQCFEGTEEELAQTSNTQPCVFAMELAVAAALSLAGIKPDVTAGFSLGEIAALTFSGAVSYEDGFRLVCRRGELMQNEAEKTDSSMVAVIKLSDEKVEQICNQFEDVYPVNYNCVGQVSVSGLKTQLAEFKKSVKAEGGRCIPLRVVGGFHSPLMSTAAEKFGEELKNVKISSPKIPLYSNYTGLPYEDKYETLLMNQICNPVRWKDIINNMIQDGVDTFIEVGPGKTLCGLIAKIDNSVKTFHVEDCESLDKTIGEVNCAKR